MRGVIVFSFLSSFLIGSVSFAQYYPYGYQERYYPPAPRAPHRAPKPRVQQAPKPQPAKPSPLEAGKWVKESEIQNEDQNEKPFPEYISIAPATKDMLIALKLPTQDHEKRYGFSPGTCRGNSSVQNYKDGDDTYELLESARVCERQGRIDITLNWEKRDSQGRWTQVARGSYVVQQVGEELIFARTNTPHSGKTINAKAKYKK